MIPLPRTLTPPRACPSLPPIQKTPKTHHPGKRQDPERVSFEMGAVRWEHSAQHTIRLLLNKELQCQNFLIVLSILGEIYFRNAISSKALLSENLTPNIRILHKSKNRNFVNGQFYLLKDLNKENSLRWLFRIYHIVFMKRWQAICL